MKWKSKYVKLVQKHMDEPWYMKAHKNEHIWGIVEETEPGVWKIIYEGHVDFSRRSPFPLDVNRGSIPNLYYFDYEELTKKQVEKILFVDKL